jgi:hypothetical protein
MIKYVYGSLFITFVIYILLSIYDNGNEGTRCTYLKTHLKHTCNVFTFISVVICNKKSYVIM